MIKKFIVGTFVLVSAQVCLAQRYGVPNFKIVSEFTEEKAFTEGIEGPAVDKKGYVYAVNYKTEGTIGVVDYFGKSSLFVTLPKGSIGNGIVIDTLTNTMYVADYTGHNILRINMDSKKIDTLVHNKNFNQPNDICRSASGNFYLTDPDWSAGTGQLWLVTKDNVVTLLEAAMGATNGIAISPDGTTLYVTEKMQRDEKALLNIWAYDILADGKVDNKRLFFQFHDFDLDGMKIDRNGNMYVCRHGKGSVAIISPEGQMLREIFLFGQKPSNIVFGGIDKKTVYVTVQDKGQIQSFRMPLLPKKQN